MSALPALWIGSRLGPALASNHSGRVHSVFTRACNLLLDNGTFVALLHPDLPRTPWGLRLADAPPFNACLEPGLAVRVEADSQCLRLHGDSLTVPYGKAREWDAALPPLRLSAPAARAALDVLMPLLQAALPSLSPEESHANRVQHALGEGRARLGAALHAQDPEQTVEAAQSLLGLGPGLTPSGDDLLAGLLAALWAVTWPEPSAVPGLRTVLAAFVREAAPRATHPVSAVFLTHAAEGLFAEHVRDVLLTLDAPAGLPAAAARLLAFGASSGADTLSGLCLGLDAASR